MVSVTDGQPRRMSIPVVTQSENRDEHKIVVCQTSSNATASEAVQIPTREAITYREQRASLPWSNVVEPRILWALVSNVTYTLVPTYQFINQAISISIAHINNA